jgi:hypothetical protein
MWHRPIIDAVSDRERYAAFIADRLNPQACASCGLPVHADTPTVIRISNWVGIALENPQPIPVSTVFEIVATMTAPLFDVSSPDAPPILVVGRSEELRRVIANGKNDRFCAIPLDFLLFPNNAILIEELFAISDAYLGSNAPEGAYWAFTEVIGEFNELYFHRLVYEQMEIAALAAGDRIYKPLRKPQTAGSHFRFVQESFEPQRSQMPEGGQTVYFCFYENGPHKKWPNQFDASTVLADLLQLRPDGSLDTAGAERHLAFVPLQAVVQQELLPERRAFSVMLALMLGSQAIRDIGKLPQDAQSLIEISSMHFQTLWSNLIPSQKQSLAAKYSGMTGGLDIRREFRLIS